MKISKTLTLIGTTIFVVLLTGCVETEQEKQAERARQQKQRADHQRELRMVEQTAKAETTRQMLDEYQKKLEQARREGQQVGEVIGQEKGRKSMEKVAAEKQEEARRQGYLEGDSEGYDRGRNEGIEVGEALAAAVKYSEGMEKGEEFGAYKARAEASDEMLEKLDEVDRKAEERGRAIGRVTGIEEGKEINRRENYYRVVGAALAVGSFFVAIACFLYTRLAPGNARAMKKISQENQKQQDKQLLLLSERQDKVEQGWGQLAKAWEQLALTVIDKNVVEASDAEFQVVKVEEA